VGVRLTTRRRASAETPKDPYSVLVEIMRSVLVTSVGLVAWAVRRIVRWSRRCPQCGTVSRSLGRSTNAFVCASCGHRWRIESDEEEYL
jgi:rRNA maturation endonuclease Nob1